MIPVAWLRGPVPTLDVEELARLEFLRLGLSEQDWRRWQAGPAAERWRYRWAEFLKGLATGDEVWSFSSPPEESALAGAAGYAVVRGGQPISTLASWRG